MDNARLLLQRFAEVYPQEGAHHRLAYERTRNELPLAHAEVLARSSISGHVPPIQVGEEFRYRYQLMLAGLHNDPVRGICTGVTGSATCVVMKYPLHNFGAGDRNIFVGGEGGRIPEAHTMGVRILENQRMSSGNQGMLNASFERNRVRLAVYDEIQAGGENNVGDNIHNMGYRFLGLYTVEADFELETPEGFLVYQYLLTPIDA